MAKQTPTGFKADIDSRVNQNNLRAITGFIMNQVLTNMKDSLRFKFIEADTASRDSIAAQDRSKGMTVHVSSVDRVFWLRDDQTTWEQVLDSSDVQALIDASLESIENALRTPVASIAALQALNTTAEADYPNSILIAVDGVGLFIFDRASTEAADTDLIIAPTTGVGRWIRTSLKASELSFLTDLIQSGFDVQDIIRLYAIKTVTSNDSLATIDRSVLVDASAGDVTITLPDPTAVEGYRYDIKKIDNTANRVIIVPFDGELIEFGTSVTLAIRGEIANVESNAVDWHLM